MLHIIFKRCIITLKVELICLIINRLDLFLMLIKYWLNCNLINILICVIYADVIWVMTGVGVEREYKRDGGKTKMNVIELNSNG